MRNPKIKLSLKTDKELDKKVNCSSCKKKERYGSMFFYVDESNISITKNANPICYKCKINK